MSTGDMGSMRLQQQAVEVTEDLISFLWKTFYDEKTKDCAADDRLAKDDILASQSVKDFAQWCKTYLAKNRPGTTFPADLNVGVTLSEGQSVLIATPGSQQRGEMLQTPLGANQRANVPASFANQGAVPMSATKKQSGATDYSQFNQANYEQSGGRKEDATLGKKPEKLDHENPYGRDL